MSDEALSWVRAHFERHNLNASEEWMRACVDWFLNNESSNLNRMRLVEGVRKQWLDTDIRKADVQKEPRLQAGHLAKGKLKALSPLRETIVLQVLTAVDISKPAYNQLEALNKVDTENLEVNSERTQVKTWAPPPPSRCLKMVLTDGFTTVDALEFEPCPSELPEPVATGTKITLSGSIQIRRGVLLLKPANVKCLGGVVQQDEMANKESLSSELSKRLEQQSLNDTGNTNIPTQKYTPPPNARSMIKYKNPEAAAKATARRHTVKKEVKREPKPSDPFGDDDDDMFNEIPDEAMVKMDDADDSLFSSIEMPDEAASNTNTRRANPPPATMKSGNCGDSIKVKVKAEGPIKVEVNSDCSVKVEVTRSQPKDNFRSQQQNKRVLEATRTSDNSNSKKAKRPNLSRSDVEGLLSGRPFQYLKSVRAKDGVHTVKACFVTLAGKLSTVKREGKKCWTLATVITDGSDTVEAVLSPELLEKWLGASVEQVSALDARGKSEFKTKIKDLLADKLLNMNALMKVRVVSKDKTEAVVVIDTVPLNRGHAQQLKVRNSKF